MKNLTYIIFICLLHSTQIFSQNSTCNCSENFKKLVVKTEENYAGFPVKVNKKSRQAYKKLKDSIEKKSISINTPKSCFFLLKAYIHFFKDKHFTLAYSNASDFDKTILTISEDGFKKKLEKKNITALEGIWINADSTLKLAIQKSSTNVYKGIVLYSKDSSISNGLVYFTLTSKNKKLVTKPYDYFISTEIPAIQKGNLLQIWNFNMFGKIYPTKLSNAEKLELNTWRDNNNGLNFKKLSAQTAYLKIPTFQQNDAKIQQLITQNDSTIKTCENLIVDLSGNGGGNTGWVSFLSYFITNPIIQYDTYLRVTPENVQSKIADIEPFVLNPIPPEYKKYFPENVIAAYKKAYTELPTTKEEFYPIPGVTFPVDSILKRPKKIALVVDDLCGSSAEYFFYISKQSKKTKTYGVNTIGMMDYEGMSTPTILPYDKFILTIPIVKSSWTDTQPIDQTGFKPDILLNNIPQDKWIEFIQKDLEKK